MEMRGGEGGNGKEGEKRSEARVRGGVSVGTGPLIG